MSSATPNRRTIQINLNNTHYVGGNRYRMQFPTPLNLTKNRASIALSQYAIYNSTYNISETLQNNTYTITWVDGASKTFTIEDGYYSFSDLNLHLQYSMVGQGWYLQNTTTTKQIQYFISTQSNDIQYKSEIDIFYVPSEMPSGYALPSNATWTLPDEPTYLQLTLSPGLQTLFGITKQAVLPESQTIQTSATGEPKNLAFLSNTYPILSPTFAYTLTCNFLYNPITTQPNILAQIPLTASYGSLVSQTFAASRMLTVQPGHYNFMEVSVLDQHLSPLVLTDPEITLSLLLEFDE